MCYGCWDKAGTPQIDTPAVREAARAIAEVYEHSCSGGNLHVVIDDWNIEDSHVAWCSKVIDNAGVLPDDGNLAECHKRDNEERRIHPDPPEQLVAERRCCDLFKALSFDERASALALHDGFWGAERHALVEDLK